jgi:hypothetical protein
MGVKIDTGPLRAKIEELIREQAGKAISGEAKMDAVIEEAAQWADDHTKWGFLGPLGPIAEGMDGVVFRGVLRIVGQFLFEELRKIGQA